MAAIPTATIAFNFRIEPDLDSVLRQTSQKLRQSKSQTARLVLRRYFEHQGLLTPATDEVMK